ncbi:MAG: CHC2 zinc finger domain-containing protein [Chloroflexi bacterium]|nr:CHC2 zinc finger domain-containing protein [Chloroflexota bacterium]
MLSPHRASNERRELSREEIDAIRARHPIEQVVSQYADLHPSSRLLQARCPLPGHDDTGPSFTVYVQSQSFYCFGCNRGGDVFKFIQLMEHVGFRDAVDKLEGSSIVVEPTRTARQKEQANPRSRRVLDEDACHLLTAAAEVYHASLLLNDRMLNYVIGRGITMEIIKRFRLGYAIGTNLAKYFRFRGWDLQLGKDLGLVGDHGEFFRERIIIPGWQHGNAIYLVGRKTKGYQQVKYLGLPGAAKPLYGLEGVIRLREVFIVEGCFDMLTLVQWGYPAVALLGSHLKAEWEQALAFAARIFVVTDSDEAGRVSAKTIAETFGARSIIVPPLPNAKDVNELALQPKGREHFAQLVSQARHAREGERERRV